MDQLNPLDVTFLDVENPGAPLAIAVVAVLEGPAPTREELGGHMAPRIAEVPRFRQRLQSVPYDVVRPIWVDAGQPDLADHLRHLTLPAPGSHADLEAAVEDLVTFPMNRDLPLWDAWLVDGLQDGNWALLVRVHHAAVDGVGGALMMLRLFDLSPEGSGTWSVGATDEEGGGSAEGAEPSEGSPEGAEPSEGSAEGAEHPHAGPSEEIRAIAAAIDQQARHLATRLGGLVESAASGSLTRRAGDALRGLASVVTSASQPATEGMLGPVGPGRRWVTARVPLDDLRPIRHRFGGTVNDVALTALTGALREFLRARGTRLSGHSVKVFVPVSVRPEGDETTANQTSGANYVSGMVAELPVGAVDPVERLRAVIVQLRRLKFSGESLALSSVLAAAAWAPTPIARAVVRLGAPHVLSLIDTIATNVPGPPFPMYVAGRRVLEMYPYVPIREPLRMVVGMFSYDGALYVGVTGDALAMPDLRSVPEGFVHSVAELGKRADQASRAVSDEGSAGPSGAEEVPGADDVPGAHEVPGAATVAHAPTGAASLPTT